MSKVTGYFWVVSFILSSFIIHAQEITSGEDSDWKMEQFTLPGGTNGNLVTAIAEGPNGFMWFGSFAGLHRYDGHEFITFNDESADSLSTSTGLTFPNVEHLFWDSRGELWVSTFGGGVFNFDPHTEVFTRFQHDPTDSTTINNDFVHYAAEDADGQIWFATRTGAARLNQADGTFRRYKTDSSQPYTDQNNRVRVLYLDRQGTLWAASGEFFAAQLKGGLFKYNSASDSFEGYFPDPDTEGGLGYAPIKELYEDSEGNFWIGTFYGLQLMDRVAGTFTDMPYDPNLPHAPDVNNRSDAPIWSMHEDQNKGLWMGAVSFNTHDKNLSRYDPVLHTTETFPLSGMAWDITESSDGTIWVAGSAIQGEVTRLSRQKKKYDLQEGEDVVRALTDLQELNKVGGGISKILNYKINPKTNMLWAERSVVEGPSGKNIANIVSKDLSSGEITPYHFEVKTGENVNPGWSDIGMEFDDDGNLWFPISYGGVIKFDPKTGQHEQILPIDGDSTALSTNDIIYLTRDSKNNIWAGGYHAGLNRINAKTGKIKQFHFSGYYEDYPDPYLTGDFPISILEDSDGTIWVAGALELTGSVEAGGFLATINPESDDITYIDLPRIGVDNTIRFMSEDPTTGNIALDFYQNGFSIYIKETGEIKFYDPVDGSSPFQNVAGLMYDNEGYLWLSSRVSNEFARMDFSNDNIYLFESTQNHNSSPRHVQKSDEGHILFKNDFGWARIDPDKINVSTVTRTAQIQIVELSVSGVKQNHLEHSTIDTILREVDHIHMNHTAESFRLRFSDFNFSPDKSIYSYRLFPYEEDWRQINNEPVANYYKVPPGQYEFQVTASSTKGFIISPLNVKLTIHPPWWKTWWAYTLYTIGALLLGWSVHKSQRARTIRIEREKTRERELAQAKEIEKAYGELELAHTKLKSTQAQLIQSEKMASLGELTAGIAHEIQNPLNFVNNFSEINTELIEEMIEEIDAGNYDDAKELATDIKSNEEKIKHHGGRADSIVKGMLLHSRTTSGEKILTDINALCDEYLRLAYHGLRAKDSSFNATMETDFDESIAKLDVIPQDIGRVFLNLITNAFQACEGNTGIVKVTTQRSGDLAIIKIKDNGSGIPDDIKDKILQPFFTTKPTGQGTGLGLSLAFDIVTAHGGELSVESQVGKGSEFIIHLPII